MYLDESTNNNQTKMKLTSEDRNDNNDVIVGKHRHHRANLVVPIHIITGVNRDDSSHSLSHHRSHCNHQQKEINSMKINKNNNSRMRTKSVVDVLVAGDMLRVLMIVMFSLTIVTRPFMLVTAAAIPSSSLSSSSSNGLNVVKLPSLYWNVNNRLFSDVDQVCCHNF